VLVWQSGFAPRLVAQLRGMGIAVFISEPRSIAQVATTMQRLAVLLDTQAYATPHIAAWQQGWQHLPAWNRNTPTAQAQRGPVRVFYQAWEKPLMALGGSHVVSDVLARCGATNVLQHVHKLAINLNPEALLPLQPELILSSGPASHRTNLEKQWASWQGLPAVRHGHIALVPPSILVRNGPRLLEAARHVCAHVAAVATRP
jgi:iron complex transport system substrate-binding protein